jgi:hypothetical protein
MSLSGGLIGGFIGGVSLSCNSHGAMNADEAKKIN